MSHRYEIIGTAITLHTSERPDLVSVTDKFRFTPSGMISHYLLSREEVGKSVLCVEIDCFVDSQGCLPDYLYEYDCISLTAWPNFIYKCISKHSLFCLREESFLGIYMLAFWLDRAFITPLFFIHWLLWGWLWSRWKEL